MSYLKSLLRYTCLNQKIIRGNNYRYILLFNSIFILKNIFFKHYKANKLIVK